ncbi:MAG: adventurous gliding motility lipoprotein CglC [Anaeromyxobacteraceae bacterium]
MPLLVFVAVTALGAGCQPPDVGARCDIAWGTSTVPAPTPATIPGDYLETGNPTCDSLVCIVSPATSGEYSTCAAGNSQCGYCSKPCVSDSDCYKSETGLVCRQMVLDPAFIDQLDPVVAERYLGDARYSRYCAVPL